MHRVHRPTNYSLLKMEALVFYKALVHMFKSTQRHISEVRNITLLYDR
jgi:hypothetical protein